MATQEQLPGGIVYDPGSQVAYVYVPAIRLYLPLSIATGLATSAEVAAAIAAAIAGPLNPSSLATEGTVSAGAAQVGGTAVTGDGDDLFIEGARVLVAGVSHYRFKGFIRVFATGPQAIAADTRAVLIRAVGGGGGGGGAQGGAAGGAAGAGGAGGAYVEAWKTDVAGVTLSVTIGAGGSAGASTGGNGGAGGQTIIARPSGWTLTADGGSGGFGQTNANFTQATSPGFGGNAAGGDINIGGEAGLPGLRFDTNNNAAGKGGSSRFGAGGAAFSGNAAGQQGLGQGAGGGGGAVAANATGRAGGAGSAGYVDIWEFV